MPCGRDCQGANHSPSRPARQLRSVRLPYVTGVAGQVAALHGIDQVVAHHDSTCAGVDGRPQWQ
jgi:hypothetical protein